MPAPTHRALALALLLAAAPAGAADPQFDPTFGASGFVRVGFGAGYSDEPTCVLTQPDGMLLSGGYSSGPDGIYVAIARHFPNGLPDSSGFGAAGQVKFRAHYRDYLNALAVAPDGRIVGVGMRMTNNNTSSQRATVYRFLPDGTPDVTFADSGSVTIHFDEFSSTEFTGVRVLPDGRIRAAGRMNRSSNGGNHGWIQLQLGANGHSDPAFGDSLGGRLHLETGLQFTQPAVEFLADGGLLMASAVQVSGVMHYVLVRFDAAGFAVPGFGAGGRVDTGILARTTSEVSLTSYADGRFILAASTPRAGGGADWLVARFLADGSPDSSFGVGGQAVIQFSTGGISDEPNDVCILGDGRILVVGQSGSATPVMARLTDVGALDPSFDGDGKVTLDLSSGTSGSTLHEVRVTGGDKVVTLGRDRSVNNGDFVINRFGLDVVGVEEPPPPVRALRLAAGPNPLRDHTTVNFDLPAGGHVTLEVFDAAGRIVSVLADGWRAAGRHLEAWRPERSVPGGVYFARLTVREPAGGATQRRTVRLVRLR
uniref:T9SS type A sorting domain-containing protein n=1 Tax=Eiseniibacteriota bacterium TaxID=2212470 RepID=A0A832I4M3_UNCEI